MKRARAKYEAGEYGSNSGPPGMNSLNHQAQLAGWTSPRATDLGRQRTQEALERAREKGGSRALEDDVQLAGWGTPRVSDGTLAQTTTMPPSGPKGRLENEVLLAGWATPACRDTRDGRASRETMEKNARPLNEQAVTLAGWGTPTAKNAPYTYSQGDPTKPVLQLEGQARLTEPASTPGPTSTSSPVGTAKSGALDPAFSRWLQSFPIQWDHCSPGWKEWELIQQKLNELCEPQGEIEQGD